MIPTFTTQFNRIDSNKLHSKKSCPISLKMGGRSRKNKYNYDSDFILDGFPTSVSSSDSFYLDNFTDFMENKTLIKKNIDIKPRNENQKKYVELLEDKETDIIVSVGPAGTGKTMMPCHVGIKKLQNNEINKLILTRPAVSVEEQHGFLPGTLEEKMEPWLRPVFDVFYQYYTPMQVQKLISNQVIEICPLAYMRGRTFEDSWIIADESQNMTPNQMLMLLTRIGNNSKMIITGDIKQHDRGFEQNGLKDFLERLETKPVHGIEIVRFRAGDVERHKIIKHILEIYT